MLIIQPRNNRHKRKIEVSYLEKMSGKHGVVSSKKNIKKRPKSVPNKKKMKKRPEEYGNKYNSKMKKKKPINKRIAKKKQYVEDNIERII